MSTLTMFLFINKKISIPDGWKTGDICINDDDQGPVVQANDVVKIYIVISKYAEIFWWKNVSSFCSAKATHIFSAKISEYCILNPPKQLTKWPLTSLLS